LLGDHCSAPFFRALAGLHVGGAICGVVSIGTRVLADLSCDL
jgi:hypothetical protein